MGATGARIYVIILELIDSCRRRLIEDVLCYLVHIWQGVV